MTQVYQTPHKIKLKFDAIKEDASFWAGKRVLDVGCNAGLLYPLLREAGVQEYVGLDNSDEYITEARANFPEVRFELGRLEELDEYFDVIIALSTFHILDDEMFEKMLEKYAGLCKVFIVEFPVKGTSSIYHTRTEEDFYNVAKKYFKLTTCYGISPSPHDIQSTRKVFKCEN